MQVVSIKRKGVQSKGERTGSIRVALEHQHVSALVRLHVLDQNILQPAVSAAPGLRTREGAPGPTEMAASLVSDPIDIPPA